MLRRRGNSHSSSGAPIIAVTEPVETSMPANLRVTHKSLFDHTLQGIHRTDKPAFSFQGHPEASPGPHDAAPLFDHFIELIEHYRKTAK
jgi:carbamoyl-phosphate synthase small subunit